MTSNHRRKGNPQRGLEENDGKSIYDEIHGENLTRSEKLDELLITKKRTKCYSRKDRI